MTRRRLAAIAFFCLGAAADETRPRHYQVRLMNAVTSESPVGTTFHAQLLGPLNRTRPGALPARTLLQGVILRGCSIGLGFKRERALLELKFEACTLPSGQRIECDAQLTRVDNARESIKKPNVIEGAIAASHPHSWMSGMWVRPTPMLFGKAALGLTGAGGTIHAKLLPSPFAAAAIIGARITFFRLPEPEIQLPAGTDLILRIAHAATEETSSPELSSIPAATREDLRAQPVDVVQSDRSKAADIINFVFLGTPEALQQSFQDAGWSETEPFNAKTFARTYSAFASMKTYPSAPVSPLRYQGRLPDLVFQRSFNTVAKRHHIRLWRNEINSETLWMGAATHDIGISFDWNRLSFTHRIDVRIDRERNVILNDLMAAGCVTETEMIDRPELRTTARKGSFRVTDGALALIRLRPCETTGIHSSPVSSRPHGITRSICRRVILETRQYVTRGNPYYYAYRTMRWGFSRRTLMAPEE